MEMPEQNPDWPVNRGEWTSTHYVVFLLRSPFESPVVVRIDTEKALPFVQTVRMAMSRARQRAIKQLKEFKHEFRVMHRVDPDPEYPGKSLVSLWREQSLGQKIASRVRQVEINTESTK